MENIDINEAEEALSEYLSYRRGCRQALPDFCKTCEGEPVIGAIKEAIGYMSYSLPSEVAAKISEELRAALKVVDTPICRKAIREATNIKDSHDCKWLKED